MGMNENSLNIIDIHFPFVAEFERTLAVFLAKGICLIDLGILG